MTADTREILCGQNRLPQNEIIALLPFDEEMIDFFIFLSKYFR